MPNLSLLENTHRQLHDYLIFIILSFTRPWTKPCDLKKHVNCRLLSLLALVLQTGLLFRSPKAPNMQRDKKRIFSKIHVSTMHSLQCNSKSLHYFYIIRAVTRFEDDAASPHAAEQARALGDAAQLSAPPATQGNAAFSAALPRRANPNRASVCQGGTNQGVQGNLPLWAAPDRKPC